MNKPWHGIERPELPSFGEVLAQELQEQDLLGSITLVKNADYPDAFGPTVADILRAREEKAEQGPWVPACGGTEVPFTTRSGRTLLYCYQASTGKHAYLDVGTDLILSDEEAWLALGKF